MPLLFILLLIFNPAHSQPGEKNKALPLSEKWETKRASEAHNEALKLFEKGEEDLAVLLLKKQAYEKLFIPSYLELQKRGESFFILPLFWHLGLFLLALISIIFLFSYWLNPSKLGLKKTFVSLGVFAWVLGLGLVLFKPRASVIKVTSMKTTPFASSAPIGDIPPKQELLILEEKKPWVKVRSPKGSGWVKKSELFILFEKGKI